MEENILWQNNKRYFDMIENILDITADNKRISELFNNMYKNIEMEAKRKINNKLIEELYEKYNKLISKEDIEGIGILRQYREEEMIYMLNKRYKKIKYNKGTCKLIKIGKQKYKDLEYKKV